jgi:hypothetical protein
VKGGRIAGVVTPASYAAAHKEPDLSFSLSLSFSLFLSPSRPIALSAVSKWEASKKISKELIYASAKRLNAKTERESERA